MNIMKKEYIEHIYAGWLAKIIGIRLGAPVEGWSQRQIEDIYGETDGYLVDYRDFAADDDSNGPLFFLRALEDCGKGSEMKAQDVAEALLNYAPFEHGFFWWGGYGVSTEHTAYLNLRNGIKAPESGSIEQNGKTTAEQIGGQIFIDTWGLVTPGNPDIAAKLARKAASVTHGGDGIHGGIFVAVCISYAFVESDMNKILEKGLSYIPENCDYAKIVRVVMDYHKKNPNNWKDCWKFIRDNYGYDKYPGMCHIIPNTAVMILALLYGNGDFSDTLQICNRCGWDTDCNVGNIATIMGVRNGLDGIDYRKWREPVNDFLACSSVVGSRNIMDIPYGACYIAKLAAELAGEKLPAPYDKIAEDKIESCHFEFPGSTHVMRVRIEHLNKGDDYPKPEYHLMNTDESAAFGNRSLKVTANRMESGENVLVYKKTYYRPADFHDSRYDPAFSPLVYPGQTVHGSVMVPEYGLSDLQVSLYVHEVRGDRIYQGDAVVLEKGQWKQLEFVIPAMEGALLDEVGFCVHVGGERGSAQQVTVLLDYFYTDGTPDYSVEMRKEEEEVWTPVHREITQFTKLKGLFYLADGNLHLSCCDFGEAYTGSHNWKDYTAEFWLTPHTGDWHMMNVRVQGGIRSYAAGFLADGRAAILKNENGYRILSQCDFAWEKEKEYHLCVSVEGSRLILWVDDQKLLEVTDVERPYLEGAVGISVQNGSHCSCSKMAVHGNF